MALQITKISTALLIFILCLICEVKLSEEVPSVPEEEDLELISAVTEMLSKCFIQQSHRLLLAGNLTDVEIRKFLELTPSVVILRAEASNSSPGYIFKPYRLNTFIVFAETEFQLQLILESMKQTEWWNSLGFFFIFDRSQSEPNCRSGLGFLRVAWRYDLLFSNFVCSELGGQNQMFTFNPFTNKMPRPWKWVSVHEDRDNDWNLFRQEISAEMRCDALKYDKTKILDGYSGARAGILLKDTADCNLNQANIASIPSRFDFSMVQLTLSSINVTFSKNLVCYRNVSSYVSEDGDIFGALADLGEDKLDIYLSSKHLTYAKKTKISNILLETEITIVSHFQDPLSIFQKIWIFFKVWLLLSVMLIAALASVVLKFSLKKPWGSAGIEIVGLFLNGPILRESRNISFRIFFINIFLFVLIIQAVFRGQILKLIMTPEFDNIDSLEQLMELTHYKIYCTKGIKKFLDPLVSERCINVDETCEPAWTDPHAVCLQSKLYNLDVAIKRNMYIGEETLAKQFLVRRIRDDWPLREKFNRLYSNIFESGLSRYILSRIIVKLKTVSRNEDFRKIRTLEMVDLHFAFQIWVIGLVLATLCFMVEKHVNVKV